MVCFSSSVAPEACGKSRFFKIGRSTSASVCFVEQKAEGGCLERIAL